MGCDIHPVILVADRDYDWWEPVAIPDGNRCYPFFEALAGVRAGSGNTSGPQVVETRGFPPHVAPWHYEKFTDGDHSASWFTLGEAEKYDAAWLKTTYPESDWPYIQWTRWLRTMQFFAELYGTEKDRVIAVFNFDS